MPRNIQTPQTSSFRNAISNITNQARDAEILRNPNMSDNAKQIPNSRPHNPDLRNMQDQREKMINDAIELSYDMTDQLWADRGIPQAEEDPDFKTHLDEYNRQQQSYLNAILNDPVYQNTWNKKIYRQRSI